VLETVACWLRGELTLTRDELVERNVEMFLAVERALPALFPEE